MRDIVWNDHTCYIALAGLQEVANQHEPGFVRQAVAAAESCTADAADGGGHGEIRQAFAAGKRPQFNALDRIGNGDAGERCAHCEHPLGDAGQPF